MQHAHMSKQKRQSEERKNYILVPNGTVFPTFEQGAHIFILQWTPTNYVAGSVCGCGKGWDPAEGVPGYFPLGLSFPTCK